MSRQRDNDFVKGVLGRTTGAACARACTLLPDLTAGLLSDLDRQLVQGHLEHCAACRGAAVVMGWMPDLLPAMADLDPGPAFTAAVLSRTTLAVDPVTRAVRAGELVGPVGLMDRLGRWWQEQIFKPRFAMQVAYVATVILVLLTSVPGAPFRGTPSRALEMVQAGPGQMPLMGPALNYLDTRVELVLEAGWTEVEGVANGVRNNLGQRADRTTAARAALAGHWQAALEKGRDRRVAEAGFELLQAVRSGREVLRNWWRAAAAPLNQPSDPGSQT